MLSLSTESRITINLNEILLRCVVWSKVDRLWSIEDIITLK